MVRPAQSQRRFPLWKRLVFSFIVLVVATAAVETLLRLTLPASYWTLFDSAADWELDPRLGWIQKGNLRTEGLFDGRLIQFHTNPDGLLPATVRPETGRSQTRIMIFGDSTVVGRAVVPEARIHVQLKRLLRDRGIEAEVINAGVQGYSTDQVLLRMEQLIPRYSPQVILYGFCTNDLGGIRQDVVYGWPKPRFQRGAEGLVLNPPPAMSPSSTRFSIPSLIQKVALYRLLQPYLLVLRARFGGWEERNLIGLENLDYYHDPASLEGADWELFETLLRRMRRLADSEGARFYLYAHPALEEVWDPSIRELLAGAGVDRSRFDRYAVERRLRKVADSEGIPFLPQIDYFLTHAAEGPFHLLPRDPHCNPAGYRLTAQVLAPALADPPGS